MISKIVSGGRSYDLDLASGRLFREHDEPIPLSPKQWDLLCYLVANRGRLLAKGELIREVWNGAAVTDEVVAQTVRSLRKIFEDDPRTPTFIESEYGRGYRFVADVMRSNAEAVEVTSETLKSEARGLAGRLLASSGDPHDSNYIAPMLLGARRLGKKIGASAGFFASMDVLIGDIDQMRTSVTYPAPAHLSAVALTGANVDPSAFGAAIS